jgi:hypothetical protein
VAQQSGGAFLPSFGYTITGGWTFSSLPALTGYGSAVGTSGVQIIASKTLTNATLTSPVVNGAVGTVAVQSPTTTFAITAAMSGSVIYLNSTTAFVSTLPAPAAGLHYTVILKGVPASGAHTVVTATSANIIIGNQNSVAGDQGDSGTADDTISFVTGQTVAGDKVELWSDGTNWFAYAISKVAAGITFTQAS